MNADVRAALDRLKETIARIESLDQSYWSASLGTRHLDAFAEQLANDAKTAAAHIKAFGKR